MNGDNVIKVLKIRREGFTEYRVDVRSAFAMPDYQPNIPDEFVAATLANQIREFVNSSVLGECIEIEYKKLGDSWTCPYCGAKVEQRKSTSSTSTIAKRIPIIGKATGACT